jgi:rubrerythrin
MKLLVSEVHNFGGFFGGDTVTLSGVEWRLDGAEERTLTIDEAALANVADRHTVCAGMLLDLVFAGERVERATLLGAATHAELRRALGDPPLAASLEAPHTLAHRCDACALWVPTEHAPERCPVCATPLAAVDTALP